MTSRPELFRVRALECEITSRKTEDPELKRTYLDLTRNWRELADQVERLEQSYLDQGDLPASSRNG